MAVVTLEPDNRGRLMEKEEKPPRGRRGAADPGRKQTRPAAALPGDGCRGSTSLPSLPGSLDRDHPGSHRADAPRDVEGRPLETRNLG